MKRGLGIGDGGWLLAILVANASVSVSATIPYPRSPILSQLCTAPRVSQWASIRDTLWPFIRHRDGDQVFAHRDTVRTPGGSAAWCNPLQNDAEAIAAARTIYANSCAVCHGPAGKGDGVGAQNADPPPYDFTQPAFAGMHVAPGSAILYTILTRGIDGTVMPGFGHDLSGWERLALMAYITSLPGPEAVAHSAAWADTLRSRRHP